MSKILIDEDAVKKALEALEAATRYGAGGFEDAKDALREALAEQPAQQEPVARVAEVHLSRYTIEWTNGPLPEGTPLYSWSLAEQPAQQDIEELTAQRDKLADILTRTANALKGEPAELTQHSWHDLPEVAQQLKPAQQEPVGYVSSVQSNSPLMCGLTEWERKGLIALYTSPPAQQELKAAEGQRKLVQILVENWRVWPARKAVEQTSLGDVFCSAKGRDLMFGNHEIASDQDSAVVTKEMWSTVREALAEQPAPAITTEQLFALARTANLELDKVIKAFQMSAPVHQEPVGAVEVETKGNLRSYKLSAIKRLPDGVSDLYTSPPAQRTWVGLTDDEVQEIWDAFSSPASGNIVRNIEAKLKEKNT